VLGLRGLTVEVVKNLALAGVAAIKLVDNKKLSKDDATINFLAEGQV